MKVMCAWSLRFRRYYGPHVPCGSNYWTIADAVRQYSDAKVQVSLGVPSVLSNDTSGIAAAVSVAAAADHVILAVGTDLTWAHEEHDADSIAFTDAQKQLIQQVAAAAKKPVTLVTFTATPLDISAQLADPNVGAVLHVGQPSVTVLGLGDILFGNVSPAGRAVQTIYPEAYQGEVGLLSRARTQRDNFCYIFCFLQAAVVVAKCSKTTSKAPHNARSFFFIVFFFFFKHNVVQYTCVITLCAVLRL